MPNFDVAAAINDGVSQSDISNYIAQNPDLTPINMDKIPQQNPLGNILSGGQQSQGIDTGNPSGNNPIDIQNASNNLQNQSFDDYCQAFVEDMAYGKMGIYPSAIAAWNDNAQKGKAFSGLNNINEGDLVYFAPDSSNGGNGHTGIYAGNNQFISATDNGVQRYDLNDWQERTGQRLLGYVPNPQGGNNANS